LGRVGRGWEGAYEGVSMVFLDGWNHECVAPGILGSAMLVHFSALFGFILWVGRVGMGKCWLM